MASVVRGPAGPVLVDEADGAVLLVVGLLLRTVFTVAPICSNSTSSLGGWCFSCVGDPVELTALG